MDRQTQNKSHTVSEGGVTVKQYYTEQEFEIPSVVFEVTTEREESVEARFAVTDIETKRVGFHPRFRVTRGGSLMDSSCSSNNRS
jgi:hypothetical protein